VLDVGARTETVTVEAKAVVLATDRAALSQTIDARAVSELPISGRNVWSLASTTPGVLAGSTSDIGFSFRGAGQRSIQNNMTLDGISSSSNLLAMTSMRPIQDAVEEVQVQTGSTSAEYGSFLGVHVNVVTKSGRTTSTAPVTSSSRTNRSTLAAISTTARSRRTRRSAPVRRGARWAGGHPGCLRRAQPHVLHGRVGGHPAGGADEPHRVGAHR
jgi:outer membrane receptor protein involved in Fe transport